jgi:pyruvate-formate lyase-activating enzyme
MDKTEGLIKALRQMEHGTAKELVERIAEVFDAVNVDLKDLKAKIERRI